MTNFSTYLNEARKNADDYFYIGIGADYKTIYAFGRLSDEEWEKVNDEWGGFPSVDDFDNKKEYDKALAFYKKQGKKIDKVKL